MYRRSAAICAAACALYACPAAGAVEYNGGTPAGKPSADPATGGGRPIVVSPSDLAIAAGAAANGGTAPVGVTAQLTPPVPLVEDPGTGGQGESGGTDTGSDEGAATEPQASGQAAPAATTTTGLASTGFEVLILISAGFTLFLLGVVVRVTAANY